MFIDKNTKISAIFEFTKDESRDILSFRENKNKVIIFDPGLYNIAVNKSEICKVNQVTGKLYYRNIPIEKLITKDFLDVAHLIMFGYEHEQHNNLSCFKENVYDHLKLYPEMKKLLDALPIDMLPMDFLAAGILALSGIEKKYLKNSNSTLEQSAFIIAQTSVIAIYYHNRYNNIAWRDINLSSKEIFAYCILSGIKHKDTHNHLLKQSSILNTILIIHSEHGQNCSTATVRNIASVRSSIYSAISTGIAAFKGKLHGGASQHVSEMYDEIISNNLDYNQYIDEKINQKKPLMGFGQRTYNRIPNCWDPRVETMLQIINSKEFDFPEIENYKSLALGMIDRVTHDTYFSSRNLTPNPDLFNCIFYKLFGVHNTMNPVMITLGRVAGWMANFFEHSDAKYPLTRPCDLEK